MLIKARTNPKVKALLDKVRFIDMPITNADGSRVHPRRAARGAWCACQCDYGGVDLNRNYPFGWGSNLGVTFAARGSGPGSEPEVKNTMEIVQQEPGRELVTQHTNSRAIFYPGLEIFAGHAPDLDNGYRDLALAMAARHQRRLHERPRLGARLRDQRRDERLVLLRDPRHRQHARAGRLRRRAARRRCRRLPNCTTADYSGTPGRRSTAAQTARFQGHPVRNAIWLNLIYATLAGRALPDHGPAVPGATLKITKDFNLYTAPIKRQHDAGDDRPPPRRSRRTSSPRSSSRPRARQVGRQPVRAPGPGV